MSQNCQLFLQSGHETDFTIADFVSDLRAPTPSAAGELAVVEYGDTKWKIQAFQNRLSGCLKKKVDNMKNKYELLCNRKAFRDPFNKLRQNELLVDSYTKQIQDKVKEKIKDSKTGLSKQVAILDKLSPLKTLSRGYGIIEDNDGKIIHSAGALSVGDKIKIVLQDGEKSAEII